MAEHRLTRREFVRSAAFGFAALALAACAPAPSPTAPAAPAEENPATATPAPTPTPVPTAPPRIYGTGKLEVVVWYQDWDGANRIMNSITPQFVEKNPDVTVNLQAIAYGDLFSKLLPSIAAGTEGDVLMAYTDWVVGTDVKQVFLDITEPVGGAAAIKEKMWEAAFTGVDLPEGKIFYLPWLAGIRGAAMTVNKDHLAEKNIDYLNFKTFEEVIEAGVALTQRDAQGKITRSGYSPRSSQYQLLWSLIWQLGGKFYDKETGKWNHDTPEGEEAAQIIYDVYWKHKTCDFDLFQSEFEAVSQKLVSIWGEGAFSASVQTDVAGIPCDNIVTPKLANAKEYVLYPQHMAVWALSRRLANAKDKLKAALDFALLLVSPDALIQAFDFYSGVCMTKAVYEDPRIEKVKYGLMSKRVATGMWPVARYPQDHVANHGPAATEFERAMRQEITIKEAFANMDAYLNEQEAQARERIGL